MMPSECPGVLRGNRGHGPGVKKSKPAMEKRRRARINASLAELRSLIPESVKRGNRRYSKMEKADILEMAVQYLRHLQDSNKEKDQMSTVSYGLGFSECTQEVSEFFRSNSPATSRFKGSLMEHLNGCVPNNPPDSPSSKPIKTTKTSANDIFASSSILARCLLSSTITSTPEKLSGHGRNSNTPAAVSSTSDEGSNECIYNVGDEDSEDDQESCEEPSSRDASEASQVQRSEIVKVKKDLFNSFSGESRARESKTGELHNDDTSTGSVDQLCGGNKVSESSGAQQSEGVNNTLMKEYLIESNEKASLTNTLNQADSATSAVGNISTCKPLLDTVVPVLIVQTLGNKEELIPATNVVQAVTSLSCTEMLVQINDNTTSNDPNNNSKAEAVPSVERLSLQQQTSEANESDTTLSVEPYHISNTSLMSSNSDNNLRSESDNNMHKKSNALPPRDSSQMSAESTPPDKLHISQNRTTIPHEPKIVFGEQYQTVSNDTTCSTENVSKISVTHGNISTNRHISSVLIPIYVQTSIAGEIPSFQQAIIVNGANSAITTNAIPPPTNKTLQTIAPNVTETGVVDLQLSTFKGLSDLLSSDTGVSTNLLPKTVNRREPLFLQLGTVSPKSTSISLINNYGHGTEVQIENKMNDFTTGVKTAARAEVPLEIASSSCQEVKIIPVDENPAERCKITNSVFSNIKPTNVSPTFIVTKVNGSCFSSYERKRSLADKDKLLEVKSDHSNKFQVENFSDSLKRMRLSYNNSQHTTYPQDRSHILNQYVSAKFRPIAPKTEDVHNMISSDCPQEGKYIQRFPKQSVPSVTGCFTGKSVPNNLQRHYCDPKIEHERFPNHRNFLFSGCGERLAILPQTSDIKICSNEGSTNKSVRDDILTTALKSRTPLDKTHFAARPLNATKLDHAVSVAETETSNNHTFQSQSILSNENHLCLSFPKDKSSTREYFVEEQLSQISLDSQRSLKDSVPQSSLEDGNMFLDLGRNITETNSGTKLHDFCHRHNIPSDTVVTIKCNVCNAASSTNHNNCSVKNTTTPPNASTENLELNKLQKDWLKTNNANIETNPHKHAGVFFNLRNCEEKELPLQSFAQKAISGKVWSSFSARGSTNPYDMKKVTNIVQTSNSEALPHFIDSLSPQPLNLSLRGPKGQTRTPRIQDTDAVEEECSPVIELSVRDCLKKATLDSNCLLDNSHPTTIRQWDNDSDLGTIEPRSQEYFPLNSRPDKINKDVRNVGHFSTSFHAARTASAKETTEAKLPSNILRCQQHFTNAECTTCINEHRSIISLQCSSDAINSRTIVPQTDSKICNTKLVTISPTWIKTSGSSFAINQTSQAAEHESSLNSRRLMAASECLVLAQKGSFVSDKTETADDDVWRPW